MLRPDQAGHALWRIGSQVAHLDASVYDENVGDYFAWADSCIRPIRTTCHSRTSAPSGDVEGRSDLDVLPGQRQEVERRQADHCRRLRVHLQHFARPDYDFEWFYSMANIANWGDVVSGKKPAEELGAKKIDDYTFSVTTDQPTPYLDKIFADLW